MKRFLFTLTFLALIAALAAFALTPVALRQRRLKEDADLARDYRDAADRLSLLDCGTLTSQAQEYNAALADAGAAEAGDDEYTSLLDPAGNGVMSVLELPKLGATLPVHHDGEGAGARVTHVAGSRLPVSGAGGPCVLRATRERFYDPLAGLDRLIAGDCFHLRVLQETQTYEVVQVTTASDGSLPGTEDGDECVLIGAASAGDGGQRLAVRGRRVSRRSVKPADDSWALPLWASELVFAVPVAALGLVVLAIIEWLRRTVRRSMRRRMKL